LHKVSIFQQRATAFPAEYLVREKQILECEHTIVPGQYSMEGRRIRGTSLSALLDFEISDWAAWDQGSGEQHRLVHR
jgi:hypothetical protein